MYRTSSAISLSIHAEVKCLTLSTTIVIVNYRGYDDLERCLQSLEPELRAGDEVIVVDNESDHRELEAVSERHPRVLAIPCSENLGFASGVNVAARHTRAPFLLLLNPDTIIEGPVVETLENWLHSHPDVAVVGPRVLNGDGSTQSSARRFPGFSTLLGGRSTWWTRRYPNNWCTRRNLLGLDASKPLDVDWLSGSCLMTRREVFDRLGGLDESFFLYWEDADYCWRVAAAGGRRTYLPSVAIRHLGGGSSRYNLPRAIRSFHESAFHLYRKRSGFFGRIGAPVVHAGLYLRGELRLRRALRGVRSPMAPRYGPLSSVARFSEPRGEVQPFEPRI